MTKKFGKVQYVNGRNIVINLDEPFDEYTMQKFSNGTQPTIELNLQDGRTITNEQRKKVFAMLHDISQSTGYTLFEAEDLMKAEYMVSQHQDYFSLSNTSVSNASKFIEFLILFCFKMGIPFKFKTVDEIRDDYRFQRECVLHRKCLICGERAEIDHVDPIGMGRNRKKLDNSQFRFEALCHDHHMLKHKMKFQDFENKFHIRVQPIKLTHDEVKRLHIGG